MQANAPQPSRETPPSAVISLALGILSCSLLGFVAGIPAVVCGHVARRKVRVAPQRYGGGPLALAGVVLGYVGTVVSAIALLLIIHAAHNLHNAVDRARAARVKTDCEAISRMLKLYHDMNGDYPTTEQGLRALVTQPIIEPRPKRWYPLFRELPKDPWNRPYTYRSPGFRAPAAYDLFSVGADGIPDTRDDIWPP